MGAKPLQPKQLAVRMVFYAAGFLFVFLGVGPYLGHLVGVVTGLQAFVMAHIGTPEPGMRILGVVVFALGCISYAISSLWLVIVGKGPFVEFDPPREFVACGPYRWMRNPVSASLQLAVLGEALFVPSIGILLLFLIGLPLGHLQVIRIEEPKLRERFGESYEQYCRKVNRWLPRAPTP